MRMRPQTCEETIWSAPTPACCPCNCPAAVGIPQTAALLLADGVLPCSRAWQATTVRGVLSVELYCIHSCQLAGRHFFDHQASFTCLCCPVTATTLAACHSHCPGSPLPSLTRALPQTSADRWLLAAACTCAVTTETVPHLMLLLHLAGVLLRHCYVMLAQAGVWGWAARLSRP